MKPGQIVVVVPAHNEEDWLPACLTALDAARRRFLHTVPRVLVSITVVLDRCTDDSARAARSIPGLSVIAGNFDSVGAARDAGVRFALARSRSLPRHTWIANTDADTVVSSMWLVNQYWLAHENDLVLGTVRPIPTGDNAERLQLWSKEYVSHDGHHHIHGANLGVRGSTYVDLGGFRAMTEDEDVDLVDRARSARVQWVASGSLQVMTSSRTVGRVAAGFAAHLRQLI